VFFETKHATLVEANTFENAVTVEVTMVEDRNLGVGFRVELTVDVNVHKIRFSPTWRLLDFFSSRKPPKGRFLETGWYG
jgi:hypothetical protein